MKNGEQAQLMMVLAGFGVLAIAVVAVRLGGGFEVFTDEELSGGQQAAAVVVAGESEQDVADAIVEAASHRGEIQRLIIDDVVIGDGIEVREGDTVTVGYIGELQGGVEFDNSYKRGAPFTFTIGDGDVIAGWEQGVPGMRVGGERILVIPASLAYGERGVGQIPPNATLVFKIELLEVE